MVMQYIRTLLERGTGSGNSVRESDIGVVTPYKLQCKVISRACLRSSLNDITVGTAELFQGQERPVMIVSTVCANGLLGFVSDPRVSDAPLFFISVFQYLMNVSNEF